MMNVPTTFNPLTMLTGGQASASNPMRPPSTSFNQVLSREVSQRPASPEASKAPTPAKPQSPEKPKSADKAKASDAPKGEEPTPAKPASTEAAPPKTEEKSNAKDAAGLSDIPGAPQAALVMNLMGLAPVSAEKPAEAMPAVTEGAERALVDLRERPASGNDAAALRLAQDGATKPNGTGEDARLDLQTAFGKAIGEAVDVHAAKTLAGSNTDAMAALTPTQSDPKTEAQSTVQAALTSLQAAVQTTQAPQGHTDKLTPTVGTPAWDQALGQKVVWMAKGGEQTALLTMNPADLGPMQVVLSVTDNQATVNFSAAQPEVRQALENALPRLQEMLKESGIQLGQANVNAGGQQQFAGFGGTGGERNATGRGTGTARGASGEDEPGLRESIVRIPGRGTVNTFA